MRDNATYHTLARIQLITHILPYVVRAAHPAMIPEAQDEQALASGDVVALETDVPEASAGIEPQGAGHDVLLRLRDFASTARDAYAPNTLRAVRADLTIWQQWCAGQGMPDFPAPTALVVNFVQAMGAERKPATVARYLASLAFVHRAAGLPSPADDPTVRLALRAVRRRQGRAQRQAAGLTFTVLQRIEAQMGATLLDTRDVALLRVARDLLARREELARLTVGDVTFADDGTATVNLRRSKTDQEGEGHVGFLGKDAAHALRAWLRRAHISEGPLFRAVHRAGHVRRTALPAGDIARIIRRRAVAALGSDAAARYSGHSARVGMAQDLLAANATLAAIMEAGRWTTPTMVGRYTQALSATRNAVAQFHRQRTDTRNGDL